MAKEDKNGCLHGDNDGKFVSKNKSESKPYDSKDNLGELKKKVDNQVGIRKLKKGIDSHKKTIKEHLDKIKNPNKYYPNWDSMPEIKKKGAINYWKKEIERYKKEIVKKENRIKDYYGR